MLAETSHITQISAVLMETLQYQGKEETDWCKAEQWGVLNGKQRRWPRQLYRLTLQESLQQKNEFQFENWSCIAAFENWYLLLSFLKHRYLNAKLIGNDPESTYVRRLSGNNSDG